MTALAPAPALPPVPPYSRLEDALGLLTGSFLASFGLFLLQTSGAVTGGTAGLALLLDHALPLPLGVLLAVVGVPFLALAVRRKGWPFTLRSAVSVGLLSGFVGLLSGFAGLHPLAVPAVEVAPVYAVLVGNLAAGVGILVLFRHGSSLGGFGVLALLAQERLGWRAGWVQMSLDAAVVTASLAVVAPGTSLLSAAGVVVLNLVLVLNHRPGRYLGV